jgi:beta-lactamase regulating signal transducer with metallopeptidase domain
MTALSHSPFLYALGWAIANSLWQMALLWLVYQLFFGISKKNKPVSRHLASTILLFAGFTWFTVTFISRFIELRSVRKYLVSLPALDETGKSIQDQLFQSALNLEAIVSVIEKYLPYLSAAYLVILILLSFRLLNAFAYSQRLKTDQLFSIDIHWQKFVQELVQRLGITRKVKIYLSGLIDVPATMGFIKPVILLPLATFNHLSISQVEAVILHEMAHIRRYDYLVNLLVTAVETILFFNPFTQLLSKSLKKEREMCCDDFVVRFQHDPHNYAAALLSLEKMRLGNSARLAIAATGNKDQLLSRVKRILNVKSKNLNYGQKLLALLLVAGFISSVAWLSPMPVTKQPIINEEKLAWSVNQLLKDTLDQNNVFVVKQRNKKDSIINLAKNRKKIEYQADNMYMKSGFSGDTVIFDGDINWNLLSGIPQSLEEKTVMISPLLDPENIEPPASPEMYFTSPSTSELHADVYSAPRRHLSPESYILSTNEDFQLAFKQSEWNKIKKEMEEVEKALSSETWKKLEKEAKTAGQLAELDKMQEALRKQLANAWKDLEVEYEIKKEANENNFSNNFTYHLQNNSEFWRERPEKMRKDSTLRKILSKISPSSQRRKAVAKRTNLSWQQFEETKPSVNTDKTESRSRKPSTRECEKEMELKPEGSMTFVFDDLKGLGSSNEVLAINAFAMAQNFPVVKVKAQTHLKKVIGKNKTKHKTVIRIITEKETFEIELHGDGDEDECDD